MFWGLSPKPRTDQFIYTGWPENLWFSLSSLSDAEVTDTCVADWAFTRVLEDWTWILILECQALYKLSHLPSSKSKSVLNMEFENFGMGKLICLPSLGHLLYLVWSYPSCKTGLMCLFSWVLAFLCPCLSLSQSWAWRAAYSQRQGMAFISRILEPVVYSCPRPRGRGRCLIHLISSAQSLLVAVPRSSVQTAGLNQIVSAFALLI